jgi:hypothetical protein
VDEVVIMTFLLKLVDLWRVRLKPHRSKVLDYLGMDLAGGSSPEVLIVFMIK